MADHREASSDYIGDSIDYGAKFELPWGIGVGISDPWQAQMPLLHEAVDQQYVSKCSQNFVRPSSPGYRDPFPDRIISTPQSNYAYSVEENHGAQIFTPLSSVSLISRACGFEGCDKVFNGAHSKGNLARHVRLRHKNVSEQPYPCQHCPRSYRRSDARLKHIRGKHAELEVPRVVPRQQRHDHPGTKVGSNRSSESSFGSQKAGEERVEERQYCYIKNEVSQPDKDTSDVLLESSVLVDNYGQAYRGLGYATTSAMDVIANGVPLATANNLLQPSEGEHSKATESDIRSYPSCGIVRLGDWLRFLLVRGQASGQQQVRDNPPPSSNGGGESSHATQSSKRCRDPDINEDVAGGTEKKRNKVKSRYKGDTQENTANELACPFPKSNPLRHTRCWGFAFRDTARLKDHLKRCHPVIYRCPNCGLEFSGDDREDQRDVHMNQQTPCQRRDQEGLWLDRIKPTAWNKISKRKSPRDDDEQHWMFIYGQLFPSVILPLHPYHENFIALSLRLDPHVLASTITGLMARNIGTYVSRQLQNGMRPENVLGSLTVDLLQLIEPAVNNAFTMSQRSNAASSPSSNATGPMICGPSSDSGYASTDLSSILQDDYISRPVDSCQPEDTLDHPTQAADDLRGVQGQSNPPPALVVLEDTLAPHEVADIGSAAITTDQGSLSDTRSESDYISSNDNLTRIDSPLDLNIAIDNMDDFYNSYVEIEHSWDRAPTDMLASQLCIMPSMFDLEDESFDTDPAVEQTSENTET